MTVTATEPDAAEATSATLPGVTSADDALVGTAEAARVLRVDRRTLSRWAAAGHVKPAQKTVGGHLRWDLDDLRRQIAEITEG